MPVPDESFWIRTVGAPIAGDPRDGELHQVFGGTLPPTFDLEPWDDDPDAEDARYVLAPDQTRHDLVEWRHGS